MLLPVHGITYQKTVGLIFGTNKCHLWYYAVSCFMGKCGHCDGPLNYWSTPIKCCGRKLVEVYCCLPCMALGASRRPPTAALLVTTDVKTFASVSFCAWYHMIISRYVNVSGLLSSSVLSLLSVYASGRYNGLVRSWYRVICENVTVTELVMIFAVKNAVSSILCIAVSCWLQWREESNLRVLRRTRCLDLRGRKLHQLSVRMHNIHRELLAWCHKGVLNLWGMWHLQGSCEESVRFWLRNFKDVTWEIWVYGKVVFKCILYKWAVRVWTGLVCVGSSDVLD